MSDFHFTADSPCSRGETRPVEILSAAGYAAAEIESLRAARIVS
jgi:hypothetical protein